MARCRFAGPPLMGWLVLSVSAADGPQWRGLRRDGISLETGLLDVWPAGGPPQIWKAQGLGQGYAACAITQGRLFTQEQRATTSLFWLWTQPRGKDSGRHLLVRHFYKIGATDPEGLQLSTGTSFSQ